MSSEFVLAGFSALSHPVRLALFQDMCRCAPTGVRAGELATRFNVPASTMTGHLQILDRAGLLQVERRSRFMIYSVNSRGTRLFVQYLLKDICLDRPELCDRDYREPEIVQTG
jgi:ArsR family transcriptional regulator